MDGSIANDARAEALRPLLHLGERFGREKDWPDYLAEFDLGPEHVDQLIAIACDPELHDADAECNAVWAPVHAWRALGQLRAAAFIMPLLDLLRTLDDDLFLTEAPVVLGLIGPEAIRPITAFALDPSNGAFAAANAVAGLRQIAERHPDRRQDCIDIIVRLLRDPGTDRLRNGFAVSSLLDLHAIEAIEPIRDAFRRDAVDISVAGDLEDVEIELGLRSRRDTPAPHYIEAEGWFPPPTRSEKIGRNDPCPGGSGRKYKKCCLH